jgi:hypothetical protein
MSAIENSKAVARAANGPRAFARGGAIGTRRLAAAKTGTFSVARNIRPSETAQE